jgi:hypothetical protein
LNGITPKKISGGLGDLLVLTEDDLKYDAFLCRGYLNLNLKTTKANNSTKS